MCRAGLTRACRITAAGSEFCATGAGARRTGRREYGGTDWSAIRKHIFMQEVYAASAPDFGWQGTHMLAPVLIAFGAPELKARFLPKILSGEEIWCQGFSEPGAGSDLANLKTSAALDGAEYVINGQKIWTSDAADADWGFFLVRTDATVKPQRGLSFLLVKMDTPGVTVRPIRSIDGRQDLNEVFLDNVRVPRAHLVGEAGLGWTYAKYLLEKERTASAYLYFNRQAARTGQGHRPRDPRRRRAAHRRSAVRAESGAHRGRSVGARVVGAAHPGGRAEPL